MIAQINTDFLTKSDQPIRMRTRVSIHISLFISSIYSTQQQTCAVSKNKEKQEKNKENYHRRHVAHLSLLANQPLMPARTANRSSISPYNRVQPFSLSLPIYCNQHVPPLEQRSLYIHCMCVCVYTARSAIVAISARYIYKFAESG